MSFSGRGSMASRKLKKLQPNSKLELFQYSINTAYAT